MKLADKKVCLRDFIKKFTWESSVLSHIDEYNESFKGLYCLDTSGLKRVLADEGELAKNAQPISTQG